jgi:hypothetical protein
MPGPAGRATDIVAGILWASAPHVRALATVRAVAPAGSAIGAGFIRNLVWDRMAGLPPLFGASDVDVVFHDPDGPTSERDAGIERRLGAAFALPWQVRNQARMHLGRVERPFHSLEDAVAHWPETATAVAARLDEDGVIEILAPHGLDDLLGFVVRPVPGREEACGARWARKRWGERWPLHFVGAA